MKGDLYKLKGFEKAVKRIFEEYTTDEIADGMMIPEKVTKEEYAQSLKDLAKGRKERLALMTDKQRLTLKLIQFKLLLDQYLEKNEFIPGKTFSHFLRNYITLLNRKNKDFAHEIGIKVTELSQLINDHRNPPEYVAIRLEIHSNNLIPAEKWYLLVERRKIHELKTNRKLRTQERRYVTRHVGVIF